MSKAALQNIPSYYVPFINRVPEEDILVALKRGLLIFNQYLELMPSEKENYQYAQGKWSVKEVIQHVIDSEWIFNYRALCFARGEKQKLPGYNENEFAQLADLSSKTLAEVGQEFVSLRNATIALYQSFGPAELGRSGNANDLECSVELLGFITEGHLRHHLHVIEERYL